MVGRRLKKIVHRQALEAVLQVVVVHLRTAAVRLQHLEVVLHPAVDPAPILHRIHQLTEREVEISVKENNLRLLAGEGLLLLGLDDQDQDLLGGKGEKGVRLLNLQNCT